MGRRTTGKDKVFPKGALCPICKKNRVDEPNEAVDLRGGAMFGTEDLAGPDKRMYGYLDLHHHAAHGPEVPKGASTDAVVSLVEEASNGQFELRVCSIECLRRMFSDWVARLEKDMRAAARPARRRKC